MCFPTCFCLAPRHRHNWPRARNCDSTWVGWAVIRDRVSHYNMFGCIRNNRLHWAALTVAGNTGYARTMEPTRELTTVLFVLAPVMVLTVLLGLVVDSGHGGTLACSVPTKYKVIRNTGKTLNRIMIDWLVSINIWYFLISPKVFWPPSEDYQSQAV